MLAALLAFPHACGVDSSVVVPLMANVALFPTHVGLFPRLWQLRHRTAYFPHVCGVLLKTNRNYVKIKMYKESIYEEKICCIANDSGYDD